jgi:23S rRNA pseudouridine1911/1915/1917 synthase
MAEPAGWRPAALNNGWTYCDRVGAGESSSLLVDLLEKRYIHSCAVIWQQRFARGEITLNGFACADKL